VGTFLLPFSAYTNPCISSFGTPRLRLFSPGGTEQDRKKRRALAFCLSEKSCGRWKEGNFLLELGRGPMRVEMIVNAATVVSSAVKVFEHYAPLLRTLTLSTRGKKAPRTERHMNSFPVYLYELVGNRQRILQTYVFTMGDNVAERDRDTCHIGKHQRISEKILGIFELYCRGVNPPLVQDCF